MDNDTDLAPPVTAAGVRHVMLSYHYHDAGDLDGYASLLDTDAELKHPDLPYGHGSAAVVKILTERRRFGTRHEVFKVIAHQDTVVVTGRMTHGSSKSEEFADVFTLSAVGLLLGYRRYYFTAPG